MNIKKFLVGGTAGALILGAVAVSAFATGPTCTVDKNDTLAYSTIQAAVNDSACATIIVAAGTYNEQVVINRPLTLEGESGESGERLTIIRPLNVTSKTTSLFSGNSITAVVLVNEAQNVSIKDLTVDGNGAEAIISGCPTYVGIFFRASSGEIKNTHVTNIAREGSNGCQGLLGIFVQSGNGGPNLNSDVVIDGNKVDNYGKNGITANEAGTKVTITNNTVTGRGPVESGDAAQNGIQVAFGASGKVYGNHISDNEYDLGTWTACGIVGSGLGIAKDNYFTNNEQNICSEGKGGPKNL